jgi:hypothetical protein
MAAPIFLFKCLQGLEMEKVKGFGGRDESDDEITAAGTKITNQEIDNVDGGRYWTQSVKGQR